MQEGERKEIQVILTISVSVDEFSLKTKAVIFSLFPALLTCKPRFYRAEQTCLLDCILLFNSTF